MKRIVILALALGLLAALLTACGTMSPSPKTSPTSNPSPSAAASPSPATSPSPAASPSPATSPSPAASPSPETSPNTSPSPSAAASAGGLEGSLADVLKSIDVSASSKLSGDNTIPETFQEEITGDKSPLLLGVSSKQLDTYAEESVSSQTMFGFGYMSALVKCKDAASARELKKLIADNFKAEEIWVCVIPEECFVVEYEQYVLLGVAPAETCTALREAFSEAAGGSIGEADRFFIQ